MEKNVVKINENTLKQIVAESVKNVLKEGSTNKKLIDAWFGIKDMVGGDEMVDWIWSALSHDKLVELVKYFNRMYELGLDVNDIY